MLATSGSPRSVYTAAVERLAASVVRALQGTDGAFRLCDQVRSLEEPAGLAAVRVLGADALAPFVLGGHRFRTDDAEVVAASMRAFPVTEHHAQLDGQPGAEVPVRRLREWATGEVLARLGVTGFAGPCPKGADVGRDHSWLSWVVVLAQLAPLAVPGLDSPLHVQVKKYRRDVARGVTRAVLRRDYLSAARLVRWLSIVNESADDKWFALDPVTRHIEMVAERDASLLLELAVARSGRQVSGR